MIIAQICIFIFGASAVWLVGRTEKWRRWGYINGLCGGPFWLYVTAVNNQWGIFALSLFYSYSWGQGVYNFWIKPWRETRKIARREPTEGYQPNDVLDTSNPPR